MRSRLVSSLPFPLILLSASFAAHAAIAGGPVGEGAEQNISEGASMCLLSADVTAGGQTVSIGVMGKDSFYGAPAATIFKITTGAKQGETRRNRLEKRGSQGSSRSRRKTGAQQVTGSNRYSRSFAIPCAIHARPYPSRQVPQSAAPYSR